MKTSDHSTQNATKKKSHPFWRWFWLTFLVLSLAYAWYSFYAPSNAIKWVSNITSVQELPKKTTKNTLLFFTGKWCSPCQIMKREVFADKAVEQIVNSELTPVKIDIDNPTFKPLVDYYEIGTTPTTVIVNSEGEVLDYAVGKIDKNKFLDMVSNCK